MNEHVLQVGRVAIPYAVRFSDRATKRRIEVTIAGVSVIAPMGSALDGADGVHAYVDKKRRWIYDAHREIELKRALVLRQHWVSGAKLTYRGRNLMLDVRPGEVEGVEITCRSKFHVCVPTGLGELDQLDAVRLAFDAWLRERALDDAERFGRRYALRLEVQPRAVRLGAQKWAWGTCGKDRVLRINWELVKAPVAAMEYVVAHEVTHLLERNHSDRFWRLLGDAMPDWAERKAMLEAWEGSRHRRV